MKPARRPNPRFGLILIVIVAELSHLAGTLAVLMT